MISQNSCRFVAASALAVALYVMIQLVDWRYVVPKYVIGHENTRFAFLLKLKPLCTVEVIKKHCIERNYFPTGGKWLNSSYVPDLCRFPSNGITKGRFRACLTRRNLKKLVIFGDSNGKRYFKAMERLLRKFMECRTVKIENGTMKPDVNYFIKDTNLKASDIVVHLRDCRGCVSIAVTCSDDTTQLNLEYIAMEFYLDTEVTTVRNNWQNNCFPTKDAPKCRQSNTYQEFIFDEYLEDNYPDVILLFSGSHDKTRSGLRKIRGDMEYLKILIKRSIPKQTTLFWFTRLSENQHQKSKYWKDRIYEGKYKTNAFIDRLNRELFDVLRPELMENDGNILPFFDIYDMSLGVLNWTVHGGIHRKPLWYEVVLSNWLHTYCEN